MSDEVRTVRANGIRIAYRTWGTEDVEGTPVVLLHCLGEDGEDWRGPLIAQLAAAHPLFAPDLRGHGRSGWPGEYGLDAAEGWYEVPLDSHVARRLWEEGEGLPRWKTIRQLLPAESDRYQSFALTWAMRLGIARVHLDLYLWRG